MSAATPSIVADRDASPADQAEIRAMRVDLAAAYRLIHRLGLDDSIYTHISARPSRRCSPTTAPRCS
jgi:hypothetical protein